MEERAGCGSGRRPGRWPRREPLARYGGVCRAGRWKKEREREPQSMEERERDGGGKNRVPPFTWMPRREIIFPKIPLVAQDSFGATGLPR